jgi:hypothetical protein
MVALTSSSFEAKSSVCAMAVGNLPTIGGCWLVCAKRGEGKRGERGKKGKRGKRREQTSRQPRTKQSRDLAHQRLGGDEGVVLAGKLLDEFFVPVELLKIINGHDFGAMVLRAVNVVLAAQQTHLKGARRDGESDRAHESPIPLHVVSLEGDLELDRLDEIAPALDIGVLDDLLNSGTNTGDCDL